MKNYIQLELPVTSQDQIDWLVAELDTVGYEGFEEQDHVLKAYIPEQYWNEEVLLEIAHRVGTTYKFDLIPETNWNAVWESNFEPVTVEKFAGIRAEFHPPFEGIKHEIVITPKMSFGTGHHATTWQMILQMRDINFKQKAVLDFGTGTGVLAILAEKLGAAEILAIDNDDWSTENAAENIERNGCKNIELKKADTADQERKFDIILANINKHIILDSFAVLASQLERAGVLLLSGLLLLDEADIVAAAGRHQLRIVRREEKDNWLCLKLSY